LKNKNKPVNDNWATPKSFYDTLNAEFNFDFDPCPLSYEPITPETDGLLIPWGKRNFINPPYSAALKQKFIQRAVIESCKGNLCVCLLPVSTSTRLFHKWIKPFAKEIRFLEGRIKFEGVSITGERAKGTGMFDSMIVVFHNPGLYEVLF